MITRKSSNLNWVIFMSVTTIKGEAEGMCGRRLAKAQEGRGGQVGWVREGNKWSI